MNNELSGNKYVSRNFLERVGGIDKVPRPTGHANIPFSSYAAYNIPIPDYKSQDLIDNYGKSWVYACISKIAEQAANIDIKLYKKSSDGGIEEVADHNSLDLLERVNPYMTFYDLKEATYSYLETTGKAFWWLVKNDSESEILEIYPWLSPADMVVVPSAKTFIGGYIYKIPKTGETIEFKPEDIIFFKYFNPDNPYDGYSPLQAATLALETDKQSSMYNYRFFKNQARPGGVLEFENPIDKDQSEIIKANWEENHREGQEHKIAVIGQGKYHELGMSQKDMDFNAQRGFSRDEILAMFKVPKSVLGIVEDVNRANAEATQNFFIKETILPKVRKFVNYLNEFLLPNFQNENSKDVLFFDYVNPVVEDRDIALRTYENGTNNSWLSTNEIREMEGLEPVEGGDEIPERNNQPALFSQDISNQKKLGSKIKHKPNMIPKSKPANSVIKNRIKKMAGKDENLEDKMDKVVKSKVTIHKYEKRWQEKIALTNSQEKPISEEMRKLFKEQEKKVLKTIKEKSMSTESQKAITFGFDLAAETSLFKKAIAPLLTAIAKVWGRRGMTEVNQNPESFDLDSGVKKWINEEGLRMAKEVNGVTKAKIKKQLSEGIKAGESIPQIKDRISSVYKEATKNRANLIARTETTYASNKAQVDAWNQSGVVIGKQWITAADERVCPYCEPLDGKQILLNDNYFNKGDNYSGKADNPISFGYSDVLAPPLHPSCRCDLVPITSNLKVSHTTATKQIDKEYYKSLIAQGYDEGTAYAMAANKELALERNNVNKSLDNILNELS